MGIVQVIGVKLGICQEGSQAWHAWKGDISIHTCVFGIGKGHEMASCTFLINMPPGQQKSLSGRLGVQSGRQQESDSSLLPQGSPWTAPWREVACRRQRTQK